MMKVQVGQKNPHRCPYCRDDVRGGELIGCKPCGTISHAACFYEHGRCASCGHQRTPSIPARVANAPIYRHDAARIASPLVEARAFDPAQVYSIWLSRVKIINESLAEILSFSLGGLAVYIVLKGILWFHSGNFSFFGTMIALCLIALVFALRLAGHFTSRMILRRLELQHYKLEANRLQAIARLEVRDPRENRAVPPPVTDLQPDSPEVQAIKLTPEKGCIVTCCAVCHGKLVLRGHKHLLREKVARCSSCPSWMHATCAKGEPCCPTPKCQDGKLEWHHQGIDPNHAPCSRCVEVVPIRAS